MKHDAWCDGQSSRQSLHLSRHSFRFCRPASTPFSNAQSILILDTCLQFPPKLSESSMRFFLLSIAMDHRLPLGRWAEISADGRSLDAPQVESDDAPGHFVESRTPSAGFHQDQGLSRCIRHRLRSKESAVHAGARASLSQCVANGVVPTPGNRG